MFHPDFRPRLQLHLVSIEFEDFLKEREKVGDSEFNSKVADAVDAEIAKVADEATAVRELGDKLAELLVVAMSGYGTEALPPGADPFGIYPALVGVHPAVLQSLYNHFLGNDPRDLVA